MRIRMSLAPFVLGLAILCLTSVFDAAPAVAGKGNPPNPDYIAVGDSLTVGRRASDPATTGFVPNLAAYLASELGPGNSPPKSGGHGNAFKTANLGQLEDFTTTDMINDGALDEVVAMLMKHNQNGSSQDDVQVLTLTIGGNDLREVLNDPACAPPFSGCALAVQQKLAQVGANLQQIMGAIRTAAGPDAIIATASYYYPFLGVCALPQPLAGLAAQALAGLNATIAGAAAANGVLVANVAGASLGVSDMYGDCIHPNDSGYAKIAQAFEAIIGPALP